MARSKKSRLGRPKGSVNKKPKTEVVHSVVTASAGLETSFALKLLDVYERLNRAESNIQALVANHNKMTAEVNNILSQASQRIRTLEMQLQALTVTEGAPNDILQKAQEHWIAKNAAGITGSGALQAALRLTDVSKNENEQPSRA